MTPDEHALQARALADQANHYSYGDGGNAATGLALAAEGIVHALLALRPAPVAVRLDFGGPTAESAPAPLVEGELPRLRGAVVRATVEEMYGDPPGRLVLCRLPDLDRGTDRIPWCSSSGGWYGDEHLSDVEVLFPGVQS